jgi:hypothetical protein
VSGLTTVLLLVGGSLAPRGKHVVLDIWPARSGRFRALVVAGGSLPPSFRLCRVGDSITWP